MKTLDSLFQSIKLFMMTFLFLHLGACIWSFIGLLPFYYPNTWIGHNKLDIEQPFVVYTNAFYYCIVVLTTVGYGDIVAFNTIERIFTIIWMMFGITFYSFTLTFITLYFTSQDSKQQMYKNKLEEFQIFLKKYSIPGKLQLKIF
jgi:hypothetical protein